MQWWTPFTFNSLSSLLISIGCRLNTCLSDVILFITAVITVQSDGRLSQPNVDFALFLKPFVASMNPRTNIGIVDTDRDMFGN